MTSGSSKPHNSMDNKIERESVGLLRAKPEIVHNENLQARHLNASSSSSSSSVDTSEISTSKPSTPIHPGSQQILKDDESYISMSPSHFLDADNFPGPSSASQLSGVAQQAVIYGLPPMSPMSNPYVQVMDRSGGYDPNRIPSSAFVISPNTQIDWSMTSNDSLFSIHEKNRSLSRDHAFLSDELLKSGELLMFSPTFPTPVIEDLTPLKNMEMENVFWTTRTVGETIAHQPTENARKEIKKTGPPLNWNSSNLSSHSDESGTSGKSFAFPILTDGTKYGSSKAFMAKPQLEQKAPLSPPQSPPMTASSKPKERRRCSFTCTSCSSCYCSCTSFSCCSCFPCISCRCCFPVFKLRSCSRC